MKIFQIILSTCLILFTINSFAKTQQTLTTHVYNNFAFQNISTKKSDSLYNNQIIVLKSRIEHNLIGKNTFKIPKIIGKPIWTITAKDLHTSKEVCLDIDALLCRDYQEAYKSNETQCYDNCISTGPEFVAYDENSEILYFDAGTNVFGTAGTPRFLFRADIKKKTNQVSQYFYWSLYTLFITKRKISSP